MPRLGSTSVPDALRQCRLLEPAQLEELKALEARFPEAEALVRELLERGWLTTYQANQLLQGKGDELYRRSLYTFWKRTVPPPSMATFDAADRSICSMRRQSTKTPLQALVLLNDVQFVEAARFVGQRMLKEGGTTAAARVGWVFRLITSRSPSDKELAVMTQLF